MLFRSPTDAQLAEVAASFGEFADAEGVWRTDPLPQEVSGKDHVELPRIALRFSRRQPGRLRGLLNAVNAW